MSDWHPELDELLEQIATFLKSVELKIEDPTRAPPRPIVEPVTSPPIAKSGGSEREEIMKRVASFKAHQQRTIREREECAASMLNRLRATQETQR